jgi:glycosyltransferase involved in cell wall biosynthesis
MNRNKNMLLVWDRMGDYHRARWRAVEASFSDRKVYGADFGANDKLYSWHNTQSHPNYFQLSLKSPDQFDVKRLVKFCWALSTQKIGTVGVAGYGHVEYVFFLLYARLTGRKVILFAESWYPSGKLKDAVKSFFLKWCCRGFLVSGARAYDYFSLHLKIPVNRIRIGYSVVDNQHFEAPPGFLRVKKEKIILCIARFSQEKNLPVLVDAFDQSRMPKNGWKLMMVGGGQLKNQLEQQSGDHIQFLDWQDYEKLPALYHQASLFILPSLFEPWGLVVNEAMAASLPIILSSQVGCLPDLLKAGQNGWSFSPGDNKGLIDILNTISLLSILELDQMGDISRKMIGTFSPSFFATNLRSLMGED